MEKRAVDVQSQQLSIWFGSVLNLYGNSYNRLSFSISSLARVVRRGRE